MGLKAIIFGLTISACTGTCAYAADISGPGSYKDAPFAEIAWNWNGAYGGVSVGYASANTDYYLYQADHGPDSISPNGVLGTLTAGYNWTTYNNLVLGVEADLGIISASDTHNWRDHHVNVSNYGAFGTLRGRVGYAMNRFLFFGTGGVAFQETDEMVYGANGGSNAGQTSHNQDTQTGWVAGAGVEYAVTDRWSMKAEYLHMEFDKYTSQTSDDRKFDFQNQVDLVRVGLNYKLH